jgi:hypothetical protein
VVVLLDDGLEVIGITVEFLVKTLLVTIVASVEAGPLPSTFMCCASNVIVVPTGIGGETFTVQVYCFVTVVLLFTVVIDTGDKLRVYVVIPIKLFKVAVETVLKLFNESLICKL